MLNYIILLSAVTMMAYLIQILAYIQSRHYVLNA